MVASASQLVETLDTVIEGLLLHHKRIAFYRHFANVRKGSNVALYAWLSELEKEVKASPDTLYHQIDGGAENVAKTTIAIAEWLVLKGLKKKVVLTRLHTHEGTQFIYRLLAVSVRGLLILFFYSVLSSWYIIDRSDRLSICGIVESAASSHGIFSR